MMSVSFWKIFLVLLIALLVLGPTQFSELARWLGRLWSRARNLTNRIEREVTLLDDKQEK